MRISSSIIVAGVLASAAAGLALAKTAPHAATAPAAQSANNPATVVRQASTQIIDALNSHQAEIDKDPQLIQKLVREYLLPHFDFDFTSQLVLGRAWRTASPEQRKAFEEAFLHYLTATYAEGLKNYQGAKVEVLPFRGDASQEFVTVRTNVSTSGHEPVEVDYALHKTEHGWKAFDVKIAGVSYVQTYRNEFQQELQQTSLGALIKRLQNAQAPKSLTAVKAAAQNG